MKVKKIINKLFLSFIVFLLLISSKNISKAFTGFSSFNNSPRMTFTINEKKYDDVKITFTDYSGLDGSKIEFYSAENGKIGKKISNTKYISIIDKTYNKDNSKIISLVYKISNKYLNKKSTNFYVIVNDINNSDCNFKTFFRINSKNNSKYTLDLAPRVGSWYAQGNTITINACDNGGIEYVKLYDMNASNSSNEIVVKNNLPKGNSKISFSLNKFSQKDEKYKIKIVAQDKNKTNMTKTVCFSLEKVKDLSLSPQKLTLLQGKQKKLQVLIVPENASSKLIWSSSNPKIATVDNNGTITAIKEGTAEITVQSSSSKKATCPITVVATSKKDLSLNGHQVTLPSGNDRIYFLGFNYTIPQRSQRSSVDDIILESNGRFAMIDTGYTGKFGALTVKYLQDIGVKELEYILITHAHVDHYGGLRSILNSNNINVKKIYIKNISNGKSNRINNYKKIIQLAKNKKIKICYVNTTDNKVNYNIPSPSFGDFKINFYNKLDRQYGKSKNYQPIDENINSITALAKIYGKKIYFSSDIMNSNPQYTGESRIDAEIESAKSVGAVDVYKVSHHGLVYWANNSEKALSILKPRYNIITGHPENEIMVSKYGNIKTRLEKYSRGNNEIYYTGQNTVILSIKPNGSLTFTKVPLGN